MAQSIACIAVLTTATTRLARWQLKTRTDAIGLPFLTWPSYTFTSSLSSGNVIIRGNLAFNRLNLRDEALSALKEAIRLAQEASDNVCLQHALSWLYCLTDLSKDKLLEHSILKSLDLNLSYTMSLGIQAFAQYAGINGATPKQIFAVG